MGEPPPPVDEGHRVMLSASGCCGLPEPRTAASMCSTGEHLSGRLVGITLTAAHVDHTGCPSSRVLGGLPAATKN